MVVSLANVSPAHARHYYTGTLARDRADRSQWYGNLAQALGVSASVGRSDFENLLSAKTPAGDVLIDKIRLHQQQIHAKTSVKTSPTERAGLDLTASAPKSVSIQSLIFGDDRLEAAHQWANAVMLRVLEERYAMTRITDGKVRLKVNTGALAIASFHHDTSRALDPQLHTHNIVLNLQQHPKTGRWQSLDNAAIYQAKMLLGQIYRNELACLVQDLGYRICLLQKPHGLWELDGFSTQQLKAFSTRTQQIETVVGTDASALAKLRATQLTRPIKQDISRVDLWEHWQEQATFAQMESLSPVPQLLIQHPAQLSQVLVNQSLAELKQQGKRIVREEIERFVLQQPGKISFSNLQPAIEHFAPNAMPNSTASIQCQAITGNISNDVRRIESQGRESAQSSILEPPDLTSSSSRDSFNSPSTESSHSSDSLSGLSTHGTIIGSPPATAQSFEGSFITGRIKHSDNRNGSDCYSSSTYSRISAESGADSTPDKATPDESMGWLEPDSSSNRRPDGAIADLATTPAQEFDYPQATAGDNSKTNRSTNAFDQLAGDFSRLEQVFTSGSEELEWGEMEQGRSSTGADQGHDRAPEAATRRITSCSLGSGTQPDPSFIPADANRDPGLDAPDWQAER